MVRLDFNNTYTYLSSCKPCFEVLGSRLTVQCAGVLYHGASGRIHSTVDSTRFSGESCCWVASLTKIVTAAAAMLVVESGLIGLDDDVKHLVPQLAEVKILRGFVGNDIPYLIDNASPITLRYLSYVLIYILFYYH